MTNDHLRQRLPNRRFRRLLPAAVAAVTIAASAPLAHPHAVHAAAPKRAHMTAPPGKIPAPPRASATRGEQVQRTASV